MVLPPPRFTLFPYTTLFRSQALEAVGRSCGKNCVASPASLFPCRSTSLRLRVLRPQLKRDPLGERTSFENKPTPLKRISVFLATWLSAGLGDMVGFIPGRAV